MERRKRENFKARSAVAGALCTLAAGCATASSSPAAGGARNNLYICAMHVSNAPPVDAHGRILSYTPYFNVRGVLLSRAPVKACVSSGYGPRKGGTSAFHEGVDLYTQRPAPVYAAAAGVVIEAARERGYGNVITLRHARGVETRYAHLSATDVRPGARVRRGEKIATTGKTGNATAVHLHYEILIDGRPVNPLSRRTFAGRPTEPRVPIPRHIG